MNNQITKTRLTSASLMLAASLCPASAQTLIDFNGASFDTNAQFNQPGSGGYCYWLGNVGINDQGGSPGGALTAENASPNVQYTTPIPTAGLQSFTVGALIRGNFANSASGVTATTLGLATGSYNDFSTGNYMAIKLIGTGGSSFNWYTSVFGQDFDQGGGFTLNTTDWYQVSVTFQKTAVANQWRWSSSISNFGSNGTGLSFVLASASGALSIGSTYNAASLYSGIQFRATGAATFTQLDNYIQVGSIDGYDGWALGIFGNDFATIGGRSQDPDGDGQDNENEWRARTNPLSSTSVFTVNQTTVSGQDITIGWYGRQGVNYRVMSSTNLDTWTELSGSLTAGNNTNVQVTDTKAGRDKVFYRVQVVNP
jgi:hypothetical protein